jgi:hypothetical protein
MAYRRNPKVDPNAGVMSCRVSPEEASRFEALARGMGVSVNSLLKRLVVGAIEGQRVDLIEEVRKDAEAKAHAEVARIVQFSLVPYFRELKDYCDDLQSRGEDLQSRGQDLQERFQRYMRLLRALTEDMAAYADDLRPLIERYAPEALEDEVKVT